MTVEAFFWSPFDDTRANDRNTMQAINITCVSHLVYELPRYLVRKKRHLVLQKEKLSGYGLPDQVRPGRQRLPDFDKVGTQPRDGPSNAPRRAGTRRVGTSVIDATIGVIAVALNSSARW